MMRRAMRIFRNAATVGSLVLCLAAAGMWVRSYWRCDTLRVSGTEVSANAPGESPAWSLEFDAVRGGVWMRRSSSYGSIYLDSRPGPWGMRLESTRPNAGGAGIYLPDSADDPRNWVLGFACGATSSSQDARALRIPIWTVAIAGAALPMLEFRRTIRRRGSTRLGHCPACGYDCRATPDRCPECGRETTASAPP